jgi:putative DNA primase/helicase
VRNFQQHRRPKWNGNVTGDRDNIATLERVEDAFAVPEQKLDRRPTPGASDLDDLAKLSPLEYERQREGLAEKLGIRKSVLDKEYHARHKADEAETAMPAHWTVEPWPHHVDGSLLITAIVERIRDHVVMDAEAALTVAIWIVLSWVHEAAVHSPILLITSPEANCGKSTLMGLIGLLVPCGLVVVEISPAVLYRMIEAWHPTLIVDEADHAFKNNSELRAVVNAGWTRGTGVPRCHPETHEPELFETFGPKCIGMKGLALPDTTLTRSIIIEMQRKLSDDQAQDFAHLDDARLSQLRQQLARWAKDNVESLHHTKPAMPEGFANRLAANWRLMLAIADKADMAEVVRKAATKLAQRDDDASTGVELLIDIRSVFNDLAKQDIDRITRDDLVGRLVAMGDRQWAEMHRTNKPLTATQMRGLLKRFMVKPKDIRFGDKTHKGFQVGDFADAWARYVPVRTPPQNKRNTETTAENSQKCRNTDTPSVSVKMAENSPCFDVSLDLGVRERANETDPIESLKDTSLRIKPRV